MINRIEEILINADPSANITMEHGFLIRCFNTSSLCTINRVNQVRTMGNHEIIKYHTEKLNKIDIDPVYRVIHHDDYASLDQELVRANFSILDTGVVLALRIENMERELFAFANFYEQGIFTDDMATDPWIEDFKYLTGMSQSQGDVFEANQKNTLEEQMYFGLVEKDRLIGMGYCTFIDGYVVINKIFIEERYRNLDYGKRMLKAMLIKGLLKGCKIAICDVLKEEEAALRMLSAEGFEAAYSYHYRGKNIR